MQGLKNVRFIALVGIQNNSGLEPLTKIVFSQIPEKQELGKTAWLSREDRLEHWFQSFSFALCLKGIDIGLLSVQSLFLRVGFFATLAEAQKFVEEEKTKKSCFSCEFYNPYNDYLSCAVRPTLAREKIVNCGDFRSKDELHETMQQVGVI